MPLLTDVVAVIHQNGNASTRSRVYLAETPSVFRSATFDDADNSYQPWDTIRSCDSENGILAPKAAGTWGKPGLSTVEIKQSQHSGGLETNRRYLVMRSSEVITH
jgi:hypothetical protein